MKLFLQFSYMFILIVIFYFMLKNTNIVNTIKNNKKEIFLFFLLNLIILNLFTIIRMRMENFIPYRDYAGFYRNTLVLSNHFANKSFMEILTLIYNSILNDEYSLLAELFLVLPVNIVGNSYSKYIISMINVFIIPSNLIIYTCFLDFKLLNSYMSKFAAMTILLFFTPNIMPTYYGYIGSASLPIIVSIVYLSIYELKFNKSINYSINIFIGILLLLSVLIRRWYAYFVVSYFLSVFLIALFYYVRYRKFNDLSLIVKKLFLQGITALMLFLILFNKLFVTFLTTNYSVAYSAANKGTIFGQLLALIKYYGVFIVIICIVGFSNNKRKKMYLICLISMIISFMLFTRVQDFGYHHYFIINIQMLVMIVIGIEKIDAIKHSYLYLSIIVLLIFTNYYSVGFNKINLPFVISTNHFEIRETYEREKIESLAYFLGNTPKEYEYVYVLAASSYFNDDLIRNAFLPNEINAVPWMESTRSWDKRDGVPEKFFDYTYIVVTNPIQYNSKIEEQRVIDILANGMLYDDELRDYYRLEWQFNYINMEVMVYKRIDDIGTNIRNKYSSLFRKYYPDDKRLYEFK